MVDITVPLSKGSPSAEIDADLLKFDDNSFSVDGSKNLTLDALPLATATQQGQMSAAVFNKVAGIEAGATGDMNGTEIANALAAAGFSVPSADGSGVVAPTLLWSSDAGQAINVDTDHAFTVTEDPDDFEILIFDVKPTRTMRQLAVGLRDGDEWPETETDNRGTVVVDSGANSGEVEIWSTGAANLSITMTTGSESGWSTGDSATYYAIYGYATKSGYMARGGTAAATEATWATGDNTDQIPGSKLQNTGSRAIASGDVTAAPTNGLPGENVYYREDEDAFYKLTVGATRRPDNTMRVVFDVEEPGTTAAGFLYRGYLRHDNSNFGDATGTLSLIPGVTGTLKDGVDGVMSLQDESAGTGDLVIVMDPSDPFVPVEFVYSIAGGPSGTIGGLTLQEATPQYKIYFAASRLTAELANIWGVTPGQTGNITVDFGLRDSNGNSYIQAASTSRTFEKVSLQGHTGQTEQGGYVLSYGEHTAATSPGVITDSRTGDTYFARSVGATKDIVIEPIKVHDTEYGHTEFKPASANIPDGVNSMVWDDTTGNVVVVASNSTNRDAIKKVTYYDQDDASGTGGAITSDLIPIPAAGHPAEVFSLHGSLRDYGPHHESKEAIAGTDASDVFIASPSVQVLWDNSERRLKVGSTYPRNRDAFQILQAQRIKMQFADSNRRIRFGTGFQDGQSAPGPLVEADVEGSVDLAYWPTILHVVFQFAHSTGAPDPVILPWDTVVTSTVGASTLPQSNIQLPYEVKTSGTADRLGTLWLALQGLDADTPILDAENIFAPIGGAQYIVGPLQYHAENHAASGLRSHTYTFPEGCPNGQRIIGAEGTSLTSEVVSRIEGKWMRATILYSSNTAATVNDFADWTENYTPIHYDTLELDGVHIPVETESVELPNDASGSSAHLKINYRTAAYTTDQGAPIEVGTTYRVNMLSPRGVSAGPYDVRQVKPGGTRAQRFALLDSSDDKLGVSKEQWFFDVSARTDKISTSIPYGPGRQYEKRRFLDAFWRAMPEQTDGIVFYFQLFGSELEAVNLTQAITENMGTGLISSTFINRISAQPTSNPRDLPEVRIYAATGEPLPSAGIHIRNLTTGWGYNFTNATSNGDHWFVRPELAFSDGDQIRIQLTKHGENQPSTKNVRTNIWRK